ncbi:MAG: SurA N-terminal domain-containing protein [Verrucomicrobiae bacterium]|nr:SurA N-terminal domain-containing protein [Verrucomicrobiae bacterium]
MIIALQRAIHHYKRWIFFTLLAVILVAFVLWDYGAWSNRMGDDLRRVEVYGQMVSPQNLDKARRLMVMNYDMMGRRSSDMTERQRIMMEDQILRRMALVEKARQMGLVATDDELAEAVRMNPMFASNGQFSQDAFNRFLGQVLATRRLTDVDYEQMMREDIVIRKLMVMIAETAPVSSSEVKKLASEFAETVNAAACRFDAADFLAQVKPSEDQLQAYFKEHAAQFQVPEKRRVVYVAFPFDTAKFNPTDQEAQEAYEKNKAVFVQADGKPKPFKDVAAKIRSDLARRHAAQEAGKLATEFTVKLVPEPGKPQVSFEALATQCGLTVKQTDFFASRDSIPGVTARGFASAAFRLTEDVRVSDPVEDGGAYLVLQLLERKSPEPLPFEKVRQDVLKTVADEAAMKLAREKAEEKRKAVEQQMSEGKTFLQAAAAQGLKPVAMKGFTIMDNPGNDHFENAARRTVLRMQPGVVSELTPQPKGVFFASVLSRTSGKPEDVARMEPQVRDYLLRSQQNCVLQDFERAVVQEAKISGRQPLPQGGQEMPPMEEE